MSTHMDFFFVMSRLPHCLPFLSRGAGSRAVQAELPPPALALLLGTLPHPRPPWPTPPSLECIHISCSKEKHGIRLSGSKHCPEATCPSGSRKKAPSSPAGPIYPSSSNHCEVAFFSSCSATKTRHSTEMAVRTGPEFTNDQGPGMEKAGIL